MKKSILLILTVFLLSENVFAYIDPGTGSAVVSSLWPLIIAFFAGIIGFIIKYFWTPIKKIFT